MARQPKNKSARKPPLKKHRPRKLLKKVAIAPAVFVPTPFVVFDLYGIVLFQNGAAVNIVDPTVDLFVYGKSDPAYNAGDGSATLTDQIYVWWFSMDTTAKIGYQWQVLIPSTTLLANYGPSFTLTIQRSYPQSVETAVDFDRI